jgi:phosphoglycolate phosphatase-like HAD superfamily hydrolase
MQKIGDRSGDNLFIGDTMHDVEVGEALGLEIIILAHGHHAFEMFDGTDCQVLNGFQDLRRHLRKCYHLAL